MGPGAIQGRIPAHCPGEALMVDRRNFLSLAAAAGVLPLTANWPAVAQQDAAKLPDDALYNANEDAYWAELRKQYVIPDDEVYLNNGTVGSSPRPVLRAILEAYNDT